MFTKKILTTFIFTLLLFFAFVVNTAAQHIVESAKYEYSNSDRLFITVNDTLFSTTTTSATANFELPHVTTTGTFVRKYTQAHDSIYVPWAIQGYDANTASWYTLASGTDSVNTALSTSVTLQPFVTYRQYYTGTSAKNGVRIILKSTLLLNKEN